MPVAPIAEASAASIAEANLEASDEGFNAKLYKVDLHMASCATGVEDFGAKFNKLGLRMASGAHRGGRRGSRPL